MPDPFALSEGEEEVEARKEEEEERKRVEKKREEIRAATAAVMCVDRQINAESSCNNIL